MTNEQLALLLHEYWLRLSSIKIELASGNQKTAERMLCSLQDDLGSAQRLLQQIGRT